MNLDTLRQAEQAIAGETLEGLSKLSALGDALKVEYDDTIKPTLLLSEFVNADRSGSSIDNTDLFVLSDSDVNITITQLRTLQANNEKLYFGDTTAYCDFSLRDESGGLETVWDVTLGGTRLGFLVWTDDGWKIHVNNEVDYHNLEVHNSNDEVLTIDLYNTLENVTKSKGITYSLQELCRYSAQACSTIGLTTDFSASDAESAVHDILSTFTTTVTDKVNSLNLPQDLTSSLKTAALSGPDQLVNVISMYISQGKREAEEQDEQHATMFSSTSMAVTTWSAGTIVSNIGTVVTTIGAIALGFSRVAGAIIAAVGAITVGIGKALTYVLTERKNVSFKTTSSDQHCFSFVIGQGVTDSYLISEYLRSREWVCASLLVKSAATMIYVYLTHPEDPVSTEIGYEEHLSTDFNIFPLLSESDTLRMQIHGESTWEGRPRQITVHTSSGDKLSNIVLAPSEWALDVMGVFVPDYMTKSVLINVHDINGFDPHFYGSVQIADSAYSPISFNLVNRVINVFTEELDTILWQRLASALYIRGLNVASAHGCFQDDQEYGDNKYSMYLGPINDSEPPSGACAPEIRCSIQPLFLGAEMLLAIDLSTGSIPGTSTSLALNEIQHLYNGIPGCSHNAEYPSDQRIHAIAKWYKNDVAKSTVGNTIHIANLIGPDYVMSDDDHWVPVRSTQSTDLDKWVYYIDGGLVNSRGWIYASTSLFDKAASRNVWPSNFAVDIPSLTFTAWIQGLIIDGLILAATAAVVVAGVIGSLKIKNKQAQLQAATEKAWYDYKDPGEGDTRTEQQRWKDYKSARFKNNILATVTGGTKFGIGLYDDTESGSTIESIREAILTTGDESTGVVDDGDIVSIADVYRAIVPKRE